MQIHLNPSSLSDYEMFLKIKRLPMSSFTGRVATFPDEYAGMLGLETGKNFITEYTPPSWAFDYQRDISRLAIEKRKFAIFLECGFGKTICLLEYAKHVESVLPAGQCVLIVSPPMVINQTLRECHDFYGDSIKIERVRASQLNEWLNSNHCRIGITNYEAITDKVKKGRLGSLILDESSMLKSAYGKWGQRLIHLGRGLNFKLCLSGLPAPNDRIEYASHAVFLDVFPTINSFLARYFVNRGQTQNRWEVKPHALEPFYRDMSHWSIFVTNPGTYGWKDNSSNIPPINVHVHNVDLTDEQREAVMGCNGDLYGTPGGIVSRLKLSQISKGFTNKGAKVRTKKPAFIKKLLESWPNESTLIWTLYNREQNELSSYLPNVASMHGGTPEHERERMIDEFKAGKIKTLITKAKILGLGQNLQVVTRQIFSGLVDSYEMYHQCIKRSNRVGSTRPLNVHIPLTSVELPMVESVLRKKDMVQKDSEQQEAVFKKNMMRIM